MLSDDSSVDSDSGIRFKTDTTRNKDESDRHRRTPSSDRRRLGGRKVRSRSRTRLNRRQESPIRRRVSPRNDWRRDRRISPRRSTARLESRISPRRNKRDSPRRKEESPRRDRRRSLDKENHRSPKRDKRLSADRARSNVQKNDRKDSNTRSSLDRSKTSSINRRSLEKTDKRSSVTCSSNNEKRVEQISSSNSGKNDLQSGKTKVDNGPKRSRDRSTSADLSRRPKCHSKDNTPEQNQIKHHRKPSPISFTAKETDKKKTIEHTSKVKLIRRRSKEANDESSKDLRNKLKIYSGTTTPIMTPPTMKDREEKKKSEELYSGDESASDSQPTSYYNMITIDEVKSTSLTETIDLSDSSEDEKVLRDKLHRLEKELKKTKEKKKSKHKEKKHKKSKKVKKDNSVDEEPQKVDEFVSSTTDIPPLEHYDLSKSPSEEISSTAPKKNEESSEEGEIVSDGENNRSPIDPSDLRYVISQKITHVLPDSSDKISDSPDSGGIKLRNSEDRLISGPALPPHLKKKFEEKETDCKVEGPALPPHLKTQSGDKKSTLGPTIPVDMREKLALVDQEIPLDSNSSDLEGSESDTIGPLPVDAKHKWTKAHENLEERALRMKIGSLESDGNPGDEVKVREEWMLELPEAKALQLGLGPRQFRRREAPDLSDRSSWTDTPKDKALKAAGVVPEKKETNNELLKQEAHKKYVEERNEEQAKAVKKHKKKHNRDESLLEQHEKKLKKKKKKEEKEAGGKVRRPFDRNIDLGVNRFDDAQKKSIIKKAQLLDTRFSSGDAKFL